MELVPVYELRYAPCNQAKIQKELLTSKAQVRLMIFHVIHNLKTRTQHGKTSSLEIKLVDLKSQNNIKSHSSFSNTCKNLVI